jgi:hypothetical protein
MGPADNDISDDADEVASAPESGQIPGGREDPWDGDTPAPPGHLWPAERHGAPKDEL